MSQTQQSPESKPTSPSPSTPLTTPDQSPGHDSDIWASDDNDLFEHNDTHNHTRNPNDRELLSDLPALRRQHMTDGYREGLSVGKAKVMQSGFDAGYPIGVEIAMRVGTVLGVLEGWIAGLARSGLREEGEGREVEVKKTYDLAKAELVCTALLQGLGDEVVAGAKEIPEQVLAVIESWERRVLGRMVSRGGDERGE